MKISVRRTIVAGVATILASGAITACSHHHRQGGSETARISERATREFQLDSKQQAKLSTMLSTIAAERATVHRNARLKTELSGLIFTAKFDRSKAQAILVGDAQLASDAATNLVNASAEFYDSLTLDQQMKVRSFVKKRGA